MRIFARLTKVDAATRRVHGILVQETPDRAREIFDYETSKAHFQSWSEGIAKATDGKSVGNMREMHGNSVAGKFVEINFDDVNKSIEVVGEVVDDNAWRKVESGCYTGFSIGGSYEKKWTDPNNSTLKRYTAIPSEGSLVDMPCVPSAQFKMVKADGSEGLCKFATAPVTKVLLIEGALAKAEPLLRALAATMSVEFDKANEEVVDALLGKALDVTDATILPVVKALDDQIRTIAAEFSDEEEVAKRATDELNKRNAEQVVALGEQLTKAQADLSQATGDLAKVTGERDGALAKVAELEGTITELNKKVAAAPGVLRPVEKGTSIANGGGGTDTVTQPAGSNGREAIVLKADGTIDHLAMAERAMRKSLGLPAKTEA